MESLAVDPDLGRVVSTHRRKLTSVALLIFLALFCFAVVIGMIVVALDQYETIEIAKRLGMAMLFLVGGSVILWSIFQTLTTRVDLAEKGLRHTFREPVVARWGEIENVTVVRTNGYVKSLTLHVRGMDLIVTSEISGFATIAEALKTNGVLPRDFRL